MSRVLYVKQHARWISKNEDDFQVKIQKCVWCKEVEHHILQGRVAFDKLNLHTFETHYPTQNECVDYSLELLNSQTGVTKKRINQ